METGTVKWFNNEKGFGFIVNEQNKDIFVHFTGIEMEGFKYLNAGQKVVFKESANSRGPQATNVKVIEE